VILTSKTLSNGWKLRFKNPLVISENPHEIRIFAGRISLNTAKSDPQERVLTSKQTLRSVFWHQNRPSGACFDIKTDPQERVLTSKQTPRECFSTSENVFRPWKKLFPALKSCELATFCQPSQLFSRRKLSRATFQTRNPLAQLFRAWKKLRARKKSVQKKNMCTKKTPRTKKTQEFFFRTRKVCLLTRKVCLLTRKVCLLTRKVCLLTRKVCLLTRKVCSGIRKVCSRIRKVCSRIRKVCSRIRKVCSRIQKFAR